MSLVRVEIPMKLPSASNLREHWSARHRRAKGQRAIVTAALKDFGKWNGVYEAIAHLARGLDLEVTLTRVAPRRLDPNNVPSAFKSVMDAIAAHLGTDDRSDQYRWQYRQEKGPAAVRIEVCKAIVAAASRSA